MKQRNEHLHGDGTVPPLPPGSDAPVEVSVVMPTFRRPTLLVEAVASALGQQGARVDVLVIDDCPQGSAEATVRALNDPRVRYLRNPTPSNGRPALVRNLGWPLVCGSFVHFLDDDDIVPAGHYAAVIDAFAKRPEVGVVVGRVEAFGEDQEAVRRAQRLFDNGAHRAVRSQRLDRSWIWASRLLFQPLIFVGGAAIVRRSCIDAVGGIDASVEVMEDVDFYARTIRRFGAHYLDRVALRYRIGPSIMRREGIESRIVRSYERMHESFRERYGLAEFYMLKLAARTVLRVI